ncbi:DDE-type integrase/transposase/recombinase [Streptomyces sp. NPDC059802]|uniref:DDE-type integrase/transposase/recombinase n=1 Tax=Streptomyces sp. NPDC059802 TaxID=3346952 RepID=UPI00364934A6
MCLCAVKDAFSGRIVGYSISSRMQAQLAVNALNNTVARRGDAAGCVVHSDRGPPGTPRPPSPTSAAGTASVAARAGSARAMAMPSPSRSSRASSASCSTGGAEPPRHRPGSSCSAGCRTTTGAVGIPRSATSHQPSSNSS